MTGTPRSGLTRGALEALLNDASDLSSVLERDGTIRWVSPSVERMLGYGYGESFGHSTFEYIHRSDHDRVREDLERVVQAPLGATVEHEVRARHADGSWRWVRRRLTNMLDHPEVRGVVSRLVDITDLRAVLERHRLALAAGGIATFEIDLRTLDLRWIDPVEISAAADRSRIDLTAFRSAGDLRDIIHPEDRDRARARFRASVEAGEPWRDEFRLVSDGGTVWVAMTGERVGGGRFLGTIREITAEKHTEEELARQQALVERQRDIAAAGRLAASLAHDLGNILSVVRTNADLLAEEQGSNESLEDIRRVTSRAGELVDRLVTMTRPPDAASGTTPVAPVCRQLADLLPRVLGEGIEVRADVAENAGTVALDDIALERILLNLAVNARDAMAGGGTLTLVVDRVSSEGTDPLVRIVVRDTGVGMPPDVAEHAFEPFFTTKVTGGAGLGLSYVQSAVDAVGGTASIHTEPGEGTTVELLLPDVG